MRLWTIDERQAALRSYDILDTPGEEAFDDVVEIACALTGSPVALVSFVDINRQWFKAARGTDLAQTSLADSICAHAVAADADMLLIGDTLVDPRTRDMSIVTAEPFVRAYAGALLRGRGGEPLGTVCVLDVVPRDFSEETVKSLKALARQVSAHLELRRSAAERSVAAAALRDADLGRELALQAARLGRWDHRPHRGQRFYDARTREILGVGPDEEIPLERMTALIWPEDRDGVGRALKTALSPDRVGPYDVEFRVRDPSTGDARWVSTIGRTLFENGVCVRFFGVVEDITARRSAEEQRALLTGELNHRVKNILALAQSVVDATLRTAADLREARETAGARLRALSRAHDVLLASNWDPAPVAELVSAVVRNLSLDVARLEIAGPAVRLGSRPALQLALALHELATNAAKYGALANDTGRISIRWGLSGGVDDERFDFLWRERGGPPVKAPDRAGFGSRVIERATAAAFKGEVRLDYPPEGVAWSISAAMAGLRDEGSLV